MSLSTDIKDREFQKFVEDTTNKVAVRVSIVDSFAPQNYDYVEMAYTIGNMTSVIYKTGGSGGTTVATLTLTYDADNNLLTVTKS